ncbi:MAG: hypothetical protein MK291_08465 [Planctomycetes bacterium]|nr:hypothetical protein [Planctomycetota bacterium]
MKWLWSLFMFVCVGDDGGLADLVKEFNSRHAASRRVAIRALAGLGTERAWELVIEGLADSEGEVADEAQWQLAHAPVLDTLLGRRGLRSPDPWVRLRAAELFGRSNRAVDGWSLARQLSRREPELSASLSWSLERLARAGALVGDRERCVRELARAVRWGGQAGASALVCLQALDGEGLTLELDRAAEGRDALLRAAAGEVSVRRGDEGDWERVQRLAQDEDAGVRRALMEALDIAPGRRAAALCIERLGLEESPLVRARILHHLRSWSGLFHRYDARPWRVWLQDLSEEWAPSGPTSPVSVPGATRTFAGVPVHSERVCVLVDLSGSIHTKMGEESTRRGFVAIELERLLMALPGSAMFNVICFADEPHPWSDGLVKNRRGRAVEALRWFERLNVRGKGDLFAAAELALEDAEVDTLLIFTDGVPTGGRRWKLELMASLLEQECRFRGVSVDSVLVGASARTARCWQKIAERTGGHSMQLKVHLGTEGAGGG